jgi:hypothetical protein
MPEGIGTPAAFAVTSNGITVPRYESGVLGALFP